MNCQSLIRSFEKEEHAKSFIGGCIYLRSLEYYRSLEDEVRRDENEGTIKTKSRSSSYLSYLAILCMSDQRIPDLKKYGNYLVKILDPNELLEGIREIFKDSKQISVKLDRVKYYKDDDCYEAVCITETYFYKNEKYISDEEYRIVIDFRDIDELKNRANAKFRFWKITHGKKQECIFINTLEEFKASIRESTDYGDDHYFQVKLSNLQFKSELIERKQAIVTVM